MSERSVTVFSNSRCPSPVAPDPFALSNSLEATLKHPTSVNPDWIETIADLKNNPRVLQTPPYNENGALHWVDKNNELLYMTFPGRLELYGKYNKTGPYFSLMENQKTTIPSLGKLKAVFQLAPLTILSGPNIPQDAIDCSSRAMNVLQSLSASLDEKRNEHLDVSKHAASTPFHRTDVDTNEFKFLIHTKSIFRNLPNPGNLSVRPMTLNDLKSSKSTTLPRPTDMKHNSKILRNDDIDHRSETSNLNIRDFPDPEDIYSLTLGAADTSQSSVYIPNVRDEDGKIITPDRYDKKLVDGTIVSVTVFLKLWNLRPSAQSTSAFKRKDGDENGSRIYQTILHSLQLLPVTDIDLIVPKPVTSIPPQKRKETDDVDTSVKQRKKKQVTPPKKGDKITTRSATTSNIASGSKNDSDVNMDIAQ